MTEPMPKWISVFERHLDDGTVTASSRTFGGDFPEAAAKADAVFWARQNSHDPRVKTYAEEVASR